jgi:formylglycine-generating enzyme required for sulfatase activity
VIRLNDLPASLQSALGKALEDKPNDRYQSAAEFRYALREAIDESRATLTDLAEGQCPLCGTKNESHRKFCRKCAVSLEVKCLSCNKDMPVWDEICGNCGTKQSPLITSRKEQLQQRQFQAEGLLKEGHFLDATQIAEELQGESDPRFQHLKKWSAEFIEGVKREQQQQQQRSGVLHQEAKAHQAAHDYSSAIHALEQIPASLRSPEISALLSQVQGQEARSKKLYEEIHLRIEHRELDGLIVRVDELLQLVPDRVDLSDLRDTLEKRDQQRLAARSSALFEASRLMDARKYAECAAVLRRVDSSLRTPEIEDFQKAAVSKQSRLETLQKTVDQAVKSNQLQGLLACVEELLLLKSDVTEEDKRLREQLLSRERKQRSQIKAVLQKVQQLRKEVRYDEALELLRLVPEELRHESISAALKDLQFIADQRTSAIAGLTQATNERQIRDALANADQYRGLLTSEIIADEAFESAMKQCCQRLEELQQAPERAIRRRQRHKTLIITGGAVSLLLLVVVAGSVMQQQLRQMAIADAQERGDAALEEEDFTAAVAAYGDVIRLDNTVADAWTGLALAKLQQMPPDVTGAFSDLEKSEALSTDGKKTQQARQLAHARRAVVRANGGLLMEALQDVADAERLAALPEEVAAAKAAIASAYLKCAEEAVTAKQLDTALKELSEARANTTQSEELSRVSQMIAEAYLDRAEAASQQSLVEPALAAIEAARTLQPELPRIPELQAAVLVIRAQQHLQAGDRDKASADFLQARILFSKATGLGSLAASLADGLVKRCEEAFTDGSFQEAIAALQTVAELDPQSVTLGPLRDRLGRVLIIEADKGLLAKETDRVVLLIESLAALKLLPDEQARLANALAGQYSEKCQQQVATGDLTASVSTLELLLALPSLDDAKRRGAVTSLVSAIEPLCLNQLQSSSPTAAIEVVRTLAQNGVAFSKPFKDQLMTLSADVKKEMPEGLLDPLPAIAPFDTVQAKAHQVAWASHLGLPVKVTNTVGIKLVLIPPGQFMMGSLASEAGREPDETYRKVTLSQPFQIGEFEVTQSQYKEVMGVNPSKSKVSNCPVEQVSWEDAVEFCKRLSALPEERAAGHVYRLPTEAEWEFACRAGTTTAYCFGDDAKKLRDYSWFKDNSGDKELATSETPDLKTLVANNCRTHSVGQKKANGFGLHDMHGNVWEWCFDRKGDYGSAAVVNPVGPSSGSDRVFRGGSWDYFARGCRSADRNFNVPSFRFFGLGFRVVMAPPHN